MWNVCFYVKRLRHQWHLFVVYLLLLTHWSRFAVSTDQSCFCKLSGSIDECECSIDVADDFNSNRFYPLLKQILERDFFRYYKVNLEKQCPFWDDERQCSSGGTHCGIKDCDDEVPIALKTRRRNSSEFQRKYKSSAEKTESCSSSHTDDNEGPSSNRFDPLDSTISDDAKEAFQKWDNFDDMEDKFCDVDDDNSADMHYVDLLRNPERYTGYKGQSAARVWTSIYRENCFKPDPKFDKNFLLNPKDSGMCLEKRVFFRLISGLHTSITVQVCANHYKPSPLGPGEWFPNVDMFKGRFSEETTKGEGPQRLKNLYFTYLLELRALQKAAPYLGGEMFYTGNEEEDRRTRELIASLSKLLNEFPAHFDETKMFQGHEAKARTLKEDFRQHFLNISRIMDCVACDKCRLWGKLNTHGMGTALKILFSSAAKASRNGISPGRPFFQLTRDEVVALFNSLGRFASSVNEVSMFRRLLGEKT